MPSYRAVVIADDITGANDTGHQFAARGYQTRVALADATGAAGGASGRAEKASTGNGDVLVVDTASRERSEQAAYNVVSSTVQTIDAGVVYKKLDSTLRGHLVAELQAILDESAPDLLVVAPAFPAHDRTTQDGVHLVKETPVTDAMDASENPPASADIPTLLSSLSAPIERVSLDTVQAGEEAVDTRLSALHDQQVTPLVVVCDATTDEHLRSIAVAARSLDAAVAYAGSGGLAGSLPLRNPDPSDSGVLAVVGSVSDTAMSQLDVLNPETIVPLHSPRVLTEPDAAIEAAVEDVLVTQRDHGVAVLASAPSPAAVSKTRAVADRHGLNAATVNQRISGALSETTASVHEARPLDGLVTTGGAVTSRVLDSLDASGLDLTGRAIGSGIPLARIRGGQASGTPLITKAGAFGDATTIDNSLRFLESR